MKVIVDQPTDLKKVLEQHWGDLQNVRCFYIVEPLLERGQTIKFGIAGMSSGKPWDRLKEYQILYGDRTDENTAKGVTVHFVGTTKYNRLVKKEKTEIYKLERNLKKQFGSENRHNATMLCESCGVQSVCSECVRTGSGTVCTVYVRSTNGSSIEDDHDAIFCVATSFCDAFEPRISCIPCMPL